MNFLGAGVAGKQTSLFGLASGSREHFNLALQLKLWQWVPNAARLNTDRWGKAIFLKIPHQVFSRFQLLERESPYAGSPGHRHFNAETGTFCFPNTLV